MTLTVREMTAAETDLIVEYFLNSTPEHLETLALEFPCGFHPLQAGASACAGRSRCLFSTEAWYCRATSRSAFRPRTRLSMASRPTCTCMSSTRAQAPQGAGAECVWRSVDLYFEKLQLKRLFCEPHAFNVAPNRTLQKAGFKYLKTHMTVAGAAQFSSGRDALVLIER